jgi:hypothetical protein
MEATKMRLMVMAMIAAVAARAGTAETPEALTVTVCVDPGTELLTARASESVASQIFAEIGVTIQWHRMRQCPSRSAILLSLSMQTPAEQLPPLALARSFPFEGAHIEVFFDRVKCRVEPALVIRLLAYVLVHELTHTLQEVDSHSETGIMKASWDSGDYFEMGRRGLRFTGSDIARVYAGLRDRQSRLARAAETPLIAGQ